MHKANSCSWSGKATHFTVPAAELDQVDWDQQRAALEEIEPSEIYEEAQ